jgi:hypothetical protein
VDCSGSNRGCSARIDKGRSIALYRWPRDVLCETRTAGTSGWIVGSHREDNNIVIDARWLPNWKNRALSTYELGTGITFRIACTWVV